MSDTIFFMSPTGNDANTGNSPDTAKATISGIMAALRQLQPEEPVTVNVMGGCYHLTEPVILSPADSFPVTFQAVEGENPLFTGAIKVNNWRNCEINGLQAFCSDISGLIGPEYVLESLYVNRQRKTVATFPKKQEYLRPAAPDYEIKNELFNGADHFKPEPGDFNPDWTAPLDIRVRILNRWMDALLPVKSFDAETGNLYFTKLAIFELDPKITEYAWENVRETLLEPGEWYYDGAAQTIYYLPEAGQEIDEIRAVIPSPGSLLRLEGEPLQEKYIENINFIGIKFEFGGGKRPQVGSNYDFCENKPSVIRNYGVKDNWGQGFDLNEVGSSPQAAVHVPGVIHLRGARNCSFKQCSIAHSSWYGMEIAGGCENITVEHCDIYDLGGGGIKVSGGNHALKTPLELTGRCVITDNHISNCGLDHYAAIGVILVNAFGCLVEHNHIHDLYYSGISAGWCWGYGDSVSRENRIGYNHIHDLGKGILSDMGGVYLLGIQPGTRVYNNLIHDVKCRYYGGWGLYTDEGSAHMVLEKNACFNCSCEGYHQHYGRENIVRFNVFAYGGEYGMAISSGRIQRQTGYTWPGENYARNMMFCNNVIVANPDLPFFKTWTEGTDEDQFYSESNCLYSLNGNYDAFFYYQNEENERTGTLEQWRKELRHDLCSVIGEPGFVDMDQFDFSLKPDSILHKINFPELDFSTVGVRQDA